MSAQIKNSFKAVPAADIELKTVSTTAAKPIMTTAGANVGDKKDAALKDAKGGVAATATAAPLTAAPAGGANAGDKKDTELKDAKGLGFMELMVVLKPFFWPSAGSEGAFVNRVRALSTWCAVFLSKAASLISPFFVLDATNQLVAGDYSSAYRNIIWFVVLKVASSFFKEIQGILYVKVKQQALIQLQRYTFEHLHNLSLSWHLNKKAGAVMKSMDRGVEATNSLVTYLFLYLVPALGECLAVMILFFTTFRTQWLVGVVIGVAVFIYVVATVRITIWRKKFREGKSSVAREQVRLKGLISSYLCTLYLDLDL
jgi:hypothetical protein